MWAAAGQFFSGLITTKPPVEKNSEGLWGKRWGVGGKGEWGKKEGRDYSLLKMYWILFPSLTSFMLVFIWLSTIIYNAIKLED